MKWYEIDQMPVKKYLEYERAMASIKGMEALRDIEISIYPNLKKDAQKKLLKHYERMSGRAMQREPQRFEDALKELKSWQMKK